MHDSCASLKDDDLAGRMGLQAKELNKLMAVLAADRLVQACVYSFHSGMAPELSALTFIQPSPK
jgi:hypothetical protein